MPPGVKACMDGLVYHLTHPVPHRVRCSVPRLLTALVVCVVHHACSWASACAAWFTPTIRSSGPACCPRWWPTSPARWVGSLRQCPAGSARLAVRGRGQRVLGGCGYLAGWEGGRSGPTSPARWGLGGLGRLGCGRLRMGRHRNASVGIGCPSSLSHQPPARPPLSRLAGPGAHQRRALCAALPGSQV